MGDQAQAWIERNLHTSQAGGRRGRDCQASFVELAECYAKGYHVATLDLKKAFDHITPQRACAFSMVWVSQNLADIICGLWENRKEFSDGMETTWPMPNMSLPASLKGASLKGTRSAPGHEPLAECASEAHHYVAS